MGRYRTQLTQREISKLERDPEKNIRQPANPLDSLISEEVCIDMPRDPAEYYRKKRWVLDTLDEMRKKRTA